MIRRLGHAVLAELCLQIDRVPRVDNIILHHMPAPSINLATRKVGRPPQAAQRICRERPAPISHAAGRLLEDASAQTQAHARATTTILETHSALALFHLSSYNTQPIISLTSDSYCMLFTYFRRGLPPTQLRRLALPNLGARHSLFEHSKAPRPASQTLHCYVSRRINGWMWL